MTGIETQEEEILQRLNLQWHWDFKVQLLPQMDEF
jgi:hypothetical protein